MARAWVPWRDDDFAGAEREFHASAEFCSETPTWQLHAAHVLFMRGDKYKESAAFYEPVVRQNYDSVIMMIAATIGHQYDILFCYLFLLRFCPFRQPCWPICASPTL